MCNILSLCVIEVRNLLSVLGTEIHLSSQHSYTTKNWKPSNPTTSCLGSTPTFPQ